jgi:hypothetical protein
MQIIKRHFGANHKTKTGAVQNYIFVDKMVDFFERENVLILFKTRFVYFLVDRQKNVISHSTSKELRLSIAEKKIGNPVILWNPYR